MAAIAALALVSCQGDSKKNQNPLLAEFKTPYQAPPFDIIGREHFKPAIDEAIIASRYEIDHIINNANAPTFENTIVALNNAGEQLKTISTIMFNLNYCETDSLLQTIIRDVAPVLTDFQNDINLNQDLFVRVKAVWDGKDAYNLTAEQLTLLDKTYKGFVRNGANLDKESKEKYREVTRELSKLSLIFDENVLSETNSFVLHLTKEDELAGLPQSLIDAAAIAAKQKELEGWVITLHYPIYFPFMKYSERRDLREKLFKAYNSRGLRGNEYDNSENIKSIVNLRLELANILGYPTYAHYVLENRMAESPDNVNEFLNKLLSESLPFAQEEVAEVQNFAKSLGVKHKIEKWDWGFYTEKLKNKLFNLNEEELKPYFQLEKVKDGIFTLANKLYGISFKTTSKVPLYHPDVLTYEVFDEDGTFLALLYLDFFPREGKSGGAWMTSYRDQSIENGKNIRPLVSIVTNFTKPTNDTPSLLTFGEFTTFLHEFGHALHGMLANTTYSSLSGTSVYRDFVELPSQIHENWALEKEFLDLFATHYQTGEPIPQEMVQSIIDSRNFLAGNLSVRQIGLGIVDMAWHSLQKPFSGNPIDFEIKQVALTEVLPLVKGTSTSSSFSHIFSGGYAAGYYGYKWAEVLDADAFSLFKENGIFDRETAQSFRNNILSQGGSEHPMVLYKRFRGQEPSVDALLQRSGLVKKQ
jgi:peptidyl-dipeptidase Dcp